MPSPIGTPGYTGNPNGRPKMPEEMKRAFRDAAPEALATLLQIAREGENESSRVKASEVILDRAYGKPIQSVEAEITERRAILYDAIHNAPDDQAK